MSIAASSHETKALSQLKIAVLHSILNDEPFQNSGVILRFPDLPFILNQQDIFLVDEDIENAINVENLNRLVQPVAERTIKENVLHSGKTIFFKFQSKKEESDRLLLRLNANIISASDARTTTLSSLILKFKKEQNSWKLIDSPSFLSA